MTETGQETEKPKQPNKAEVVEQLKVEKQKVADLQAQLAEAGNTDEPELTGNSIHTVQFREVDGIYKQMAMRAQEGKLTVNEWAKKIIRANLGYK